MHRVGGVGVCCVCVCVYEHGRIDKFVLLQKDLLTDILTGYYQYTGTQGDVQGYGCFYLIYVYICLHMEMWRVRERYTQIRCRDRYPFRAIHIYIHTLNVRV